MARKTTTTKKHIGVSERRAGVWWCRFVDVDGKRKSYTAKSYEAAVVLYAQAKARIKTGRAEAEKALQDVPYSQLFDDALIYSKGVHRDVRMFAARLEASRKQFGTRIASTWSVGGSPTMEWGTYIGDDHGGEVETMAAPGDIIRDGQRDGRGNDTVSNWSVVMADYTLRKINQVEARRLFRGLDAPKEAPHDRQHEM